MLGQEFVDPLATYGLTVHLQRAPGRLSPRESPAPLKFVMTVQVVVPLVHALPMLFVPRHWTVLTQQAPLPENHILRALRRSFDGKPAFHGREPLEAAVWRADPRTRGTASWSMSKIRIDTGP